MPDPHALSIDVTSREQEILEHMIRQQNNPQWLVTRAKIILRATTGQSNSKIARELGNTRQTVSSWRKRWQASEHHLAAVRNSALISP